MTGAFVNVGTPLGPTARRREEAEQQRGDHPRPRGHRRRAAPAAGDPAGPAVAAGRLVARCRWISATSPLGPRRESGRRGFYAGASEATTRRARPVRSRGARRPAASRYNAPMPELRWTEGDVPRRLRLVTSPSGIGRASDNQLVLKDFSVSRHHARVEQRGDTWWIVDLGSTNGVKVNDHYATDAMLTEGDQVQVGNFTLSFHRGDSGAGLSASSSTFLRTLEEFREDFALEPEQAKKGAGATPRERVLEALAQVARTLLEVEELEPVLVKVMEAVFSQLPAERAYILLFNPEGQAELRIARSRGGAALAEAPVSQTILDLVSRQKVAVLTSDAQSDERFAAGLSVRHAPDPLGDVRAAVAPRRRDRRALRGHAARDRVLHRREPGPAHRPRQLRRGRHRPRAPQRPHPRGAAGARAARALPLPRGGRGDRRAPPRRRRRRAPRDPRRLRAVRGPGRVHRPLRGDGPPGRRALPGRVLHPGLGRGVRVRRHARQVHRRRRDGVLRRPARAGRPRGAGGAGRSRACGAA